MPKVQHEVLLVLERIFKRKRKNLYDEKKRCDYIAHQLADRPSDCDHTTVLDAFGRVFILRDDEAVLNLLGPRMLPLMNRQFFTTAQITGLGPADRGHVGHDMWPAKRPDLNIRQPDADPNRALTPLTLAEADLGLRAIADQIERIRTAKHGVNSRARADFFQLHNIS
jgi:hypothetical protein